MNLSKSFRLMAALVASALAVHASGAPLYQPAPVSKATRAPEGLAMAMGVTVDRDAVLAAGPGGTFEATLPNGDSVSIAIDKVRRENNGDVSWTGHVQDTVRTDLMAHGTTGATGSHATIETRQGTWAITPGGDAGHDWLFDRDATVRSMPITRTPDDAIRPPNVTYSPSAKTTCPTISATPSPTVTVDVLAVIAPDFVNAQGGAAQAETRLNNLFNAINSYMAASHVAIQYRRVGTINANYGPATAGDDQAALNAITNGTGVFANIAALRNFYGADMVALFRGPNHNSGGSVGISGLAWLNGDGNGNNGDVSYMYSVMGDHPIFDGTLPAHELGHNLGNAHDRPNAGTGVGATTYAYGHYVCGTGASSACGKAGFNDTGTGFGTIMAYEQPTVAKFASPNLTCQSTRSGALSAACGVDNLQDDVRSMNCVRQSVAAFKSVGPGSCSVDSDNDGIPDCMEVPSGRVNGTRDNDVFGNALLFSAQQYRDFLAREGDADGMNFWTTQINNGTYPRAAMIEQFFTSAEFQGVIAPVARLYFAYFLRIPDYAGLEYWIGQYKAGVPLDNVSQAFATSPEFASRYGALSNAQFVTQVYANVLGRAPDAGGLAYWTGQLNGGTMTRGQVMTGFSESAEYKNLSNHEVYVTMMYVGMLRRAPDAGGFTYWVSSLDAGNSGQALIGGFLTSPEYRSRFL